MAAATPWINAQTGITQYVGDYGSNNVVPGSSWNPVNLFMQGQTIQYSLATSWQFNPEQHIFRILQDGTAGQTLIIQLPIMQQLYQQSAIWFFWLGANTVGSILQFAALADNSAINQVAGPAATFNFTCDGDKHLFIVVAVNGNYFIKMVQGRNFDVTAGTGTSVAGGPASFAVSAFAGVPIQLPSITVASATTFYGGNGVGNATETSVNGFIMTQAGTIRDLFVTTPVATTATSHIFTVRKGATYAALTDTTLTCTILATALTGNNQVQSFTVAKGDIITIKDVQAGTPEAVRAAISFCFRPSAV